MTHALISQESPCAPAAVVVRLRKGFTRGTALPGSNRPSAHSSPTHGGHSHGLGFGLAAFDGEDSEGQEPAKASLGEDGKEERRDGGKIKLVLNVAETEAGVFFPGSLWWIYEYL